MESTRGQRYSPINIPTIEEETNSVATLDDSPLIGDEQHGRDSAIDPQLGRYRSLRKPDEVYYDNSTYDEITGFKSETVNVNETSYDTASSTTLKPSTANSQRTPEKSDYVVSSLIPRYPSSVYDDEYHVDGSKTPMSFTMHGARSPASSMDEERPKFPVPAETAYHGGHVDGYHPVHSMHSNSQPTKLWQSIWLKRLTLLLMCLFCIAIMVGLLVLRFLTGPAAAIATSSTSNYYAAMFVPPIIMIIVVSLWRQVDYNLKLLAPWKELRAGPTDAHHSLLVDYVTPPQIQSLIAAFKRRHYAVLVSILAFSITKLLLILSTTLFTNRLTPVFDSFSTISESKFGVLPAGVVDEAHSSLPVDIYVTNITNGLTLPKGTTPNLAYIPLSLHSDSVYAPNFDFFQAQTDAFVPQINCSTLDVTMATPSLIQPTNVSYNSTDTPYGTNANLSLTLPGNSDCGIWNNVSVRAIDPLHFKAPEEQIEGTLQPISCQGSAETKGLLYTLTQIEYTQVLLTNVSRPEGGPLPIALITSRNVKNMVNVFCQVSHQISLVNMTETAYGSNNSVELRTNANNTKLSNLPDADLANIFQKLLTSGSNLIQMPTNQSLSPEVRSPAFDLLTITAKVKEYTDLLDTGRLRDSAETSFRGVMSQYASQNLTSPVDHNEARKHPPAFVMWSEEKLCINPVTVFLLVALLAVLALMTGLLAVLTSNEVVAQDPSSIAANATILARSTGLNRLLRKQHAPGQHNTTTLLLNKTFATAVANTMTGSSFKIVIGAESTHSAPGSVQKELRWWRPFASSLPSLLITVMSCIVPIIVLELLQHRSDANDGLIHSTDDVSTFFASHLVTAFVIIVLIAIANNLSFNIVLRAPWVVLSKGNAAASRSMLMNLNSHHSLIACLKAIQGRHPASLMAILATAAATLMIIFVPNLYTINDIVLDGPMRELVRLDTWNLSAPYSVSDDKGAATTLNLVQTNQSLSPPFVWEDLVLPGISLGDYRSEHPFPPMALEPSNTTLLVLRGNLRCDMASNLSTNTQGDFIFVTGNYGLPETCHRAGILMDQSNLQISTNFSLDSEPGSFAGQLLDLRFGTNTNTFGQIGEASSDQVADNPAVGCPSLAFIYGSLPNAMSMAICYQEIQEVQANVTFAPNSVVLDQDSPPVVEERSVKVLANPLSSSGAQSFDFRIQNNFNRQLSGSSTSNASNVDAFFQRLTTGQNATDIKLFSGSENQPKALQAINNLYRKYMSQVYNAMMRDSTKPPPLRLRARQDSGDLNDLQTRVRGARLTQNNNSKLAIQILLGITGLLLIIAYFLSRAYRGILPCSPGSIAGCMSLLAGSDLVWTQEDNICDCCGRRRRASFNADGRGSRSDVHTDDEGSNIFDESRRQFIPNNAEWMGKVDFRRVFQMHRYRMGWWQEDIMLGKRKRFGVDISGPTEPSNDDDWYLGKRGRNAHETSAIDNFLHAARARIPRSYAWPGSRNGQQRAGTFEPLRSNNRSPYMEDNAPTEMDRVRTPAKPSQSGWDMSVTQGLRGEWSRVSPSQESLGRIG